MQNIVNVFILIHIITMLLLFVFRLLWLLIMTTLQVLICSLVSGGNWMAHILYPTLPSPVFVLRHLHLILVWTIPCIMLSLMSVQLMQTSWNKLANKQRWSNKNCNSTINSHLFNLKQILNCSWYLQYIQKG